MGKARAKAKRVKGKIKESTGKALGDPELQAQGRGEKLMGQACEAGLKAARQAKKPDR
ncbi:CsbD family protein [Streptomyces sp. NPDC059176]|uniref:CsbD family protein n=1 Tax=unclassified Streptomyces TaxID=2593676 RepID=UPI00367DC54C